MLSPRRTEQNNPQLQTAALGQLLLNLPAGCTGVATTYKLSSMAALTKNPQPLTTAQLKVSEVPSLV